MVIAARPLGVGIVLAIGLGLGPLLAEIALGIGGSASAAPIGTVPLPSADLAKMMPAAPVQLMLAQADDLAPPPSPDAIVTKPPPAPLAETALPPPFPAMFGTPVIGPGMERSTYGKLETTSSSQPTMRPSLPAIGDDTPADGPGLRGAGIGEPRARASRLAH